MPRIIVIALIIFVVSSFAGRVRKRMVKPDIVEGKQKPGGFDRFLVKILIGLTVFVALFALMGIISGETEMAIVFSVMTLIFFGIVLILKREFNMTYEENDEYFIYYYKNTEYKVYYENIVNWEPGHNEIRIMDETKPEQKWIRVNVAMIKPNILLRKIADMTFAGKYEVAGDINHPDPKREYEIINFLKQYHYDHLVEDYANKLNM